MSDGKLPQSTALTEASPDSLGELFSRDPEAYTMADLDRVVLELRQQRERYAAAEAAGSRLPKATRAVLAKGPSPVINEDDLPF